MKTPRRVGGGKISDLCAIDPEAWVFVVTMITLVKGIDAFSV